ncbi:MAG: hemolysin III family protein [Oscillospiraceae bacterium]|nr:hemolysin III family protein [Oscillospiraceae bacterium]MBR4194995.1 hemolysin III family protein [Oscillospiraceae bacterium]
MAPRTPLAERSLPDYTRGEEIFNFVSHVVGGGLALVMLVLCVVRAALHRDPWAVVGSAVYGSSLAAVYAVSSVYHGLRPVRAKKVLQVLDHCTIYFLILGSYLPILLCPIRRESPVTAWVLFGIILAMTALAVTFTAIDLKKYRVLSMICYIGLGWCIVFAAPVALRAIPLPGLLWLLAGGVAYTVGAILYGLGVRRRYMHAVFHLFVILGSVLQFVCIFCYVI